MFGVCPELGEVVCETNLKDDPNRADLAARVIEQVILRRSSGEFLRDEALISDHPDLMPELGRKLHDLRSVEEAQFEATIDDKAAAASKLPADAIPGYTIQTEIHRGGQGVVYRALQQSTGRHVAIKVMYQGPFQGPYDGARFAREVRLLAKLNHPNIVTIHDSGEAAGCHYFVMDYIQGEPLDDHITRTSPSVEETIQLFRKICEAVSTAHLRGILHRDLKPSNIRVDEQGEPHVLDFGLAKAVGEDDLEETRWRSMTVTGQFVGSMPWASPEQAEGRPEQIDLRTDVYSLGVVFFQMLTGRFPYCVDGGSRQVLRNIVESKPDRVGTYRKGIRDEIETIVLTCLAKEPEHRYQSVRSLIEDIERFLSDRPLVARQPSTVYQFRKLVIRHKLPFALAGAIFVLTLGFAIWAGILYQQASREAATVSAIKKFLVDDLFESASPKVARGEQVTVREVLRTASQRVAGAFGDQPELKAAILSTLGGVHLSLGLYSQAEEQIREAYSIFEAELGADDAETLRNAALLVQAMRLGGDLAAACALGEDRLAAARRVLGSDHEATLDLAAALTGVYALLSRMDDAAELAQETLGKRRELLGDAHPDTIRALNQVGMFLTPNAARGSEIEALFREAVENARQVLGDDHPETLTAMVNLGLILRDQRRFDEAEPLLRDAYHGLSRVVGEEHPALLLAMRDYSLLLKEQNLVDESFGLMQDAVELARRTLGDEHHWTLQLRYYLGVSFVRSDCFSEAAEVLEVLSETGFRVRGETHEEAATYLSMYSYALLNLGSYSEAEKCWRRSLQIFGDGDGKLARPALWDLRQIVASLEAQQKEEEARPFAERLLELRRIDAANPEADAWQLNCYARELLSVYPQDLRAPEKALEFALLGYERSSHEYHYNRYTVALACEANGLNEQAIEYAELALAHSPIEYSFERALYERLLVRLYEDSGQPKAAEEVYRNVLSARREQFGDSHEDVASALFGLATVLAEHGRPSEAEDTLRECLSIREALLLSLADLSCPTTTTCLTMETLATLGELLESRGRSSEAQELAKRAIALSTPGLLCPLATIERVEGIGRRMASSVGNP